MTKVPERRSNPVAANHVHSSTSTVSRTSTEIISTFDSGAQRDKSTFSNHHSTLFCDAPSEAPSEAPSKATSDAPSEAPSEAHYYAERFDDSFLFVLYTNCDSFLNKREEFKLRLLKNTPDVIALTEIYPKNVQYEIQSN